MKLYKGTARSEGDWKKGNDLGLIFCATDIKIAKKYADWDGEFGLVEFEVEAHIADLNNYETALEIAEHAIAYLPDFDHIEDPEILAQEIFTGESGDDIEIMDWIGFSVLELGYDGAMQNGSVALFAELVEIERVIGLWLG